MSYSELNINPEISEKLRKFIRGNIENNSLKDIHAMLRLPMPEHGIKAGLNFSIATILFSVIAGCSVVFYNQEQKQDSSDNFKKVVKEYFPWDGGPKESGVAPEYAARIIYHVFRNPLIHNAAKLDFDLIKEIFPGNRAIVALKIDRDSPGMDELAIQQLETDIRPEGMSGAIIKVRRTHGYAILLKVEGLYWYVRQMIKQLTYDVERLKDAEAW